jgi:hypothetical protein
MRILGTAIHLYRFNQNRFNVCTPTFGSCLFNLGIKNDRLLGCKHVGTWIIEKFQTIATTLYSQVDTYIVSVNESLVGYGDRENAAWLRTFIGI